MEERERTRNAVTSGVETMAANARKQVAMENLKRAEIRRENKERKQEVYKAMTANDREKVWCSRDRVSHMVVKFGRLFTCCCYNTEEAPTRPGFPWHEFRGGRKEKPAQLRSVLWIRWIIVC